MSKDYFVAQGGRPKVNRVIYKRILVKEASYES